MLGQFVNALLGHLTTELLLIQRASPHQEEARDASTRRFQFLVRVVCYAESRGRAIRHRCGAHGVSYHTSRTNPLSDDEHHTRNDHGEERGRRRR